jgi:hypothetical protein
MAIGYGDVVLPGMWRNAGGASARPAKNHRSNTPAIIDQMMHAQLIRD